MFDRRFLITRPHDQARELVMALEAQGGQCILFPTIAITSLVAAPSVQSVVVDFNDFDMALFTSSNAVLSVFKDSIAAYRGVLLAIGPGTAKQLQMYTALPIKTPVYYSSDGLLSLPILQAVHGLNVAIFTGENAKPLLKNTLIQRGALVTEIVCYRRSCPYYSDKAIEEIVQWTELTLLVTSFEALVNLTTLFSAYADWLKRQPLLLISEAMQRYAEAYGFRHILTANGVDTTALLDCLLLEQKRQLQKD